MVRFPRSSAVRTIKQRVYDNAYFFSNHARVEMNDEGIEDADVFLVILRGRLVARQTRGGRGTRYVFRGSARDGRPIEAVCKLVPSAVRIITVYRV